MFFDQDLSTAADVQTVKKDSSNEVQRIIYEEKDNDHQVIEMRESCLKKEKPELSASKVTFSASFSPLGSASNWGEAFRLPVPGSFQRGQWQSSKNTISPFTHEDIISCTTEKLKGNLVWPVFRDFRLD